MSGAHRPALAFNHNCRLTAGLLTCVFEIQNGVASPRHDEHANHSMCRLLGSWGGDDRHDKKVQNAAVVKLTWFGHEF